MEKNLPDVSSLNSLKRFLTARSTVITIIGLLMVALTIAAVIPQKDTTAGRLSSGFNHVFTTGWFVVFTALIESSIHAEYFK